jgi:hypothetical protein
VLDYIFIYLYCPAVFFRYVLLTANSFPLGKILNVFHKVIIWGFFFALFKFPSLKSRKLKLCVSGNVLLCLTTLWITRFRYRRWWMHEYGALVEWYQQGNNEVSGQTPAPAANPKWTYYEPTARHRHSQTVSHFRLITQRFYRRVLPVSHSMSLASPQFMQ